MKRLTAALALLLLLAGQAAGQYCPPGGRCPPPSGQPPAMGDENAAVPPELVAASVKVVGQGGAGSGTCIYVDAANRTGVVLTCKHVVGGNRVFDVTFPSGRHVKGSLHATDRTADLASIVIDADESTPWVQLATSAPPQGTPLFQVGYPGGHGPVRRAGAVAGYTPSTTVRHLNPSFGVRPGDSGSGIFAAESRTLVGVVWGYAIGGHRTMAVELADIRRFCTFLPTSPPAAPPGGGPGYGPGTAPGWPEAPRLPFDPVNRQPGGGQPYKPLLPGLPDKQAIAELVRAVQEIKAQLEAAKASGQGLKGGIEAIAGKLHDIDKGMLQLKGGHEQLAGELQGAKGLLDQVRNSLAKGPLLESQLGQVAGKLPEIAGKVAALEALAGQAGGGAALITTIGAATGGLGVPVILAGLVAGGLLRRRAGNGAGTSHPAPAPPASWTPTWSPPSWPTSSPTVTAPAPVVNAAPPHFVGVEQPSEELARIYQAMKVAGQDYPGSMATINQILGLAKQLKPAASPSHV